MIITDTGEPGKMVAKPNILKYAATPEILSAETKVIIENTIKGTTLLYVYFAYHGPGLTVFTGVAHNHSIRVVNVYTGGGDLFAIIEGEFLDLVLIRNSAKFIIPSIKDSLCPRKGSRTNGRRNPFARQHFDFI